MAVWPSSGGALVRAEVGEQVVQLRQAVPRGRAAVERAAGRRVAVVALLVGLSGGVYVSAVQSAVAACTEFNRVA